MLNNRGVGEGENTIGGKHLTVTGFKRNELLRLQIQNMMCFVFRFTLNKAIAYFECSEAQSRCTQSAFENNGIKKRL